LSSEPKGPCWVSLDSALRALEERGSLHVLASRIDVLEAFHDAVLRCAEPIDGRIVEIWRVLYEADWPLSARANEWSRVELARMLLGVAESGTQQHVLDLLRTLGTSCGEPTERTHSVGNALAAAIVQHTQQAP
jgi:hypothetical protein